MGALLLALAAVDFQTQVRPVLETACLGCHGAANAQGGLRVDSPAAIAKSVTPGKPDESALYRRVTYASNSAGAMPPGGPPLKLEQQAALRDWIAEGARWPEGVTLAPRGPKRKDDATLTADLLKRIASAPHPAANAMRPYRAVIPGADAAFEMMPVPGGEFVMGSDKPDESPKRRVRLEPFWMQKTEVTWDEYRLFMFSENNGDALVDAVSHPTRPYVEMSFGMGINGFPAISMTQHAANKYAQWLSAKTGHFYRLPTEAEWEYACRAGDGEAGPLAERAWMASNSNGKYQKVGTRKANVWGLHDMLGNVMEWTLDQYAPYPKAAAVVVMPWVRATKAYPHAVRGGGWNDDAERCRCEARVGSDESWKMQDPQLPKSIWYHTDAQWLGFRVVRPLRTPSANDMHRYWNSGVENE